MAPNMKACAEKRRRNEENGVSEKLRSGEGMNRCAWDAYHISDSSAHDERCTPLDGSDMRREDVCGSKDARCCVWRRERGRNEKNCKQSVLWRARGQCVRDKLEVGRKKSLRLDWLCAIVLLPYAVADLPNTTQRTTCNAPPSLPPTANRHCCCHVQSAIFSDERY